jgi:hypothetical protein
MKKFSIAVVILLIVIQFIPVERTNPPVIYKVKWDNPKTYDYAKRACFDCHSNETVWPWYSYVAPASWLVARDVLDGRKHLNFSNGKIDDAHESSELVSNGEMPLNTYLWLHNSAKLNDTEKKEFINGLKKTFGR